MAPNVPANSYTGACGTAEQSYVPARRIDRPVGGQVGRLLGAGLRAPRPKYSRRNGHARSPPRPGPGPSGCACRSSPPGRRTCRDWRTHCSTTRGCQRSTAQPRPPTRPPGQRTRPASKSRPRPSRPRPQPGPHVAPRHGGVHCGSPHPLPTLRQAAASRAIWPWIAHRRPLRSTAAGCGPTRGPQPVRVRGSDPDRTRPGPATTLPGHLVGGTRATGHRYLHRHTAELTPTPAGAGTGPRGRAAAQRPIRGRRYMQRRGPVPGHCRPGLPWGDPRLGPSPPAGVPLTPPRRCWTHVSAGAPGQGWRPRPIPRPPGQGRPGRPDPDRQPFAGPGRHGRTVGDRPYLPRAPGDARRWGTIGPSLLGGYEQDGQRRGCPPSRQGSDHERSDSRRGFRGPG